VDAKAFVAHLYGCEACQYGYAGRGSVCVKSDETTF
jgi:hypothetical protein